MVKNVIIYQEQIFPRDIEGPLYEKILLEEDGYVYFSLIASISVIIRFSLNVYNIAEDYSIDLHQIVTVGMSWSHIELVYFWE